MSLYLELESHQNSAVQCSLPISLNVESTYARELQITALVRYEWNMLNGIMRVTGEVSYSSM